MKITKRQLVRLIKEAMDDAQIKKYKSKITKMDVGDFLYQLGFKGTVGAFAEDALKFAGFTYVKEVPGPAFNYSDQIDKFRFQAQVLGCEVEDLAYVDTEQPQASATLMSIYNIVSDKEPIAVYRNGLDELYDLGGFKVLLSGYGGYSTATICGLSDGTLHSK